MGTMMMMMVMKMMKMILSVCNQTLTDMPLQNRGSMRVNRLRAPAPPEHRVWRPVPPPRLTQHQPGAVLHLWHPPQCAFDLECLHRSTMRCCRSSCGCTCQAAPVAGCTAGFNPGMPALCRNQHSTFSSTAFGIAVLRLCHAVVFVR